MPSDRAAAPGALGLFPASGVSAAKAGGNDACSPRGLDICLSAACAVAFSVDGSLMAVAYEPDAVTLWDPLSNLLLQTLCQPLPDPGDALCFLGFPADGGALLAH